MNKFDESMNIFRIWFSQNHVISSLISKILVFINDCVAYSYISLRIECLEFKDS